MSGLVLKNDNIGRNPENPGEESYMFKKIDPDTWERKEHFDHFTNTVPCSFSITKEIEITNMLLSAKKLGFKFYPAIIHITASVINVSSNFKVAFNNNHELGYWDYLNPIYTIIDDQSKLFSLCWTQFSVDFKTFHSEFLNDLDVYPAGRGLLAKPGIPPNNFIITCIPWTGYSSFSFYFPKKENSLSPIIMVGKIENRNDRFYIPYTVLVNHATVDGYHLSCLLEEVQCQCSQEIRTEFPNDR